MLGGHVGNGSCGVIVGFHTVMEALLLGVEIAFKPGGRQEIIDNSVQEKPSQDAPALRRAHAIQQLGHNIWCTQLHPWPSKGKTRRDGLQSLDDHAFTMEERYPLVEFEAGLRMLCVPLDFPVSYAGLLMHRLQVRFPHKTGCSLSKTNHILDPNHFVLGPDDSQVAGEDP
jgi:hypothetical protein